MKAIYIPSIFDPSSDLDKLNQQLKDCHSIVWNTNVNDMSLPGSGLNSYGTLLIVDNYTRKDKLDIISQINKDRL